MEKFVPLDFACGDIMVGDGFGVWSRNLIQKRWQLAFVYKVVQYSSQLLLWTGYFAGSQRIYGKLGVLGA